MSGIYTPKGRAREYSPRALNVYRTCAHGCRYCYVPKMTRSTSESYFVPSPAPIEGLAADIEEQLSREDITEQVLLSFIGDPYSPSSDDNAVTRECLKVLLDHHVPVAILTKGGERSLGDIDLISQFDTRDIMIGATLTFDDIGLSRSWEPGAALPQERIDTLQTYHDMGVKTFASMEPVISTEQSLKLLPASVDAVDLYKLGKINHMSVPFENNWTDYIGKAVPYLRAEKKEIYVKNDLSTYAEIPLTADERDADAHTVGHRASAQRCII